MLIMSNSLRIYGERMVMNRRWRRIHRCPAAWNSLPSDVKTAENVQKTTKDFPVLQTLR